MKIVSVWLLIVVVASCSIPPASADLPDFGIILANLQNWISPDVKTGGELLEGQQTPLTSPPVDEYKALDQRVVDEATDDNLQTLYAEMKRYGCTAVRVDVTDDTGSVRRSYYLVRDEAVVRRYTGSVDATYQISYDEALKLLDMVQDETVTFDEKVEIAHILSGNPRIYEYLKLSMAGG